MKILYYYIVLLLISVNDIFAQDCNCNVNIPASQWIIDANNYNIQPGDTVCFMAGSKDYLKLMNFHGDSLNYITFRNCGGSVIIKNNYYHYGISVSNCSFFRFTGTGSDTVKYGFKILETNTGSSGLGINEKSTNYEIDHFEIANTGFSGILAKTDPTCDLSANYGYFTQYLTSIHDNYIHNTAGEGIYIGHSFFSGFITTCAGQPDTLYPHEIKGLRVFNNFLENCHWDGIQVGCATEDCEIYGNVIKNYGLDLLDGQNSGIQISGGTTGKCYNNLIANGCGNGISVFGLGNNFIFNNLILNPGKYYFPSDPTKKVYGIFCDDRTTIPGWSFNFINNTILNPKTDGIRFYSLKSNNNRFFNNIIINPGSYGNYSVINQSYIYLLNGVNYNISNNYFDVNMNNVKFIDTIHDNYKLTEFSPAKDAGLDVSLFGINFDFDFYPRPYSNTYDIGAYEYYNGNNILDNIETDKEIIISPNPNSGIFKILIKKNLKIKNYNIMIYNQLGNMLYQQNCKSASCLEFDISKIVKNGLYFIILQSETNRTIKKLIIQ